MGTLPSPVVTDDIERDAADRWCVSPARRALPSPIGLQCPVLTPLTSAGFALPNALPCPLLDASDPHPPMRLMGRRQATPEGPRSASTGSPPSATIGGS